MPMKRSVIDKIRRVIVAQKLAAMAALAAERKAAHVAREEAAARRQAARDTKPVTTVHAMQAQSVWQADQAKRAAIAEATALAADERAAPIAERLAAAFGREAAVDHLTDLSDQERRADQARREDDAAVLVQVSGGSDRSSSGA